MDTSPSISEIALRIALAALFAGLLGLEREWKSKPAGLRTHIMVGLGAACFTLVGLELYSALVTSESAVTRVDPMRIVEGVAGGIGFLGAGAIITHKGSVEGLTTAGGVWLTGAIGVACGGGHYWIASFAVAFGLFTLHLLGRLEHRIHGLRERIHEDE